MNTRMKLVLTPLAAAVIGSLVLYGCGSSGGGGDAGATVAGGTIVGVGAQSPLINVQMTLTCGDGATKFITTTGGDANPGAFAFSSVPASCVPPYLIEATGKGEMRSLDGSAKVPFDPAVNSPVRTISFDPADGKTEVNVTPVTSIVVSLAFTAAVGATDGDKLKTIRTDTALDPFRAKLAPSLVDLATGVAPVSVAGIKAAVNANPARKPEVAKLATVIAEVVQDAVAADATKKPADIITAIATDVTASKDVSDPKNLTSVSGINATQIKQKGDAIGNIVSAVVTDFGNNASGNGIKDAAKVSPIDTMNRSTQLLTAAKSDMSVPANEALVRSQAVAQIVAQADSAVTQAVTLIRATTATTDAAKAEQNGRIKAAIDAASAIKESQLAAASAAIDTAKASATTAGKAVDIDKIVTQTTAAAKIVATQIGGDTKNVYATAPTGSATVATVNPATAVGMATKTLMDVKATSVADLSNATALATISDNASKMATELVNFAPPPTVGTVAAPRTDLDNAVIKAAVISTVQKAPTGTLTAPQLTNIQIAAENLAIQDQKVAVANIGSMGSTLPPAQQIAILVKAVVDGGTAVMPAGTIDFATPLTIGTVPTVLASTTTTTLPKIVPSTTTTTTAAATTTTAAATTTTAAATTTTAAATTTTSTAAPTTTTTFTTTSTTLGIGGCQVKIGSAIGYVTGVTSFSQCVGTVYNANGGGATVTAVTSIPAGATSVAVGSLTTCDPFGAPPTAGATTLTPCKQ